MEYSDQFDVSLDIEENIISLEVIVIMKYIMGETDLN